jgi:predicted DCC family thiol-disulfide oxidoreductase YuxK
MIVFYDSDCLLCSRTIRFLRYVDKKGQLTFEALQSDKVRTMSVLICLRQARHTQNVGAENFTTLYVWHNNKCCEKSEAIFEICRGLGGFWRIFLLFAYLPKSWLNALYDWVSRNRYKWFGKSETCTFPINQKK